MLPQGYFYTKKCEPEMEHICSKSKLSIHLMSQNAFIKTCICVCMYVHIYVCMYVHVLWILLNLEKWLPQTPLPFMWIGFGLSLTFKNCLMHVLNSLILFYFSVTLGSCKLADPKGWNCLCLNCTCHPVSQTCLLT